MRPLWGVAAPWNLGLGSEAEQNKIKANTSAPTVGAELFAFILGLSNGPESWLNSSDTIL